MTEGEEAARRSIQQVADNANDRWMAAARNAVLALPHGTMFTTDRIWWRLAQQPDLITHEPRAMGAVMRQLASQGHIRNTGDYRKTGRPEAHARPIPVWERL